MKFGAHRTSHLTSISHLTTKPTHDALRHPARWRRWEDARALYQSQEAWPCCRLEAYACGGYDVACRRVRTASPPPPGRPSPHPGAH
jgi:CHAD domain-containing protein